MYPVQVPLAGPGAVFPPVPREARPAVRHRVVALEPALEGRLAPPLLLRVVRPVHGPRRLDVLQVLVGAADAVAAARRELHLRRRAFRRLSPPEWRGEGARDDSICDGLRGRTISGVPGPAPLGVP